MTIFMVFIVSCEKNNEVSLDEKPVFNTTADNLKTVIDPPYYEVETWFFYFNGTMECKPPASNCTIAIVRPKLRNDIIEFIENNKDGDFYSNTVAVLDNFELVSTFI